jgi:hypothetical protein
MCTFMAGEIHLLHSLFIRITTTFTLQVKKTGNVNTYKITLRRLRGTIVIVERQLLLYILIVCL